MDVGPGPGCCKTDVSAVTTTQPRPTQSQHAEGRIRTAWGDALPAPNPCGDQMNFIGEQLQDIDSCMAPSRNRTKWRSWGGHIHELSNLDRIVSRSSAMMLMLVAAVLLVVGCGSSPSTTDTPNNVTQKPEPDVTVAPSSTAQTVPPSPTTTPMSVVMPTANSVVVGDPQPASVQLSSGGGHTCMLNSDGKAICWGTDEIGESSPPDGVSFSAISAGGWYTCALKLDGIAVCWAQRSQSQTLDRSPPCG